MAAKRYRLEIWNSDNSARLAVATTTGMLERRRVLKGEETLTAVIRLDDGAVGHVSKGNVLRVQEVGAAEQYSLWRLSSEAKREQDAGAQSYRITADALWMDFRQGVCAQAQADGRVLVDFGLVDLTPEALLEDVIIPAYAGEAIDFVLGTVEPTDPVKLEFERTTPLEAARALEEIAPGELQFRPNADGSAYFVDLLTRIGSAEGGAELRYGKNLRATQRKADYTEVVTRLFAFGGQGLTLGAAEWTVDSIGGSAGARTLSFVETNPVFEDDAFVGLWFYVPDKGGYPIDASSATLGQITVDDTSLPALSTGDVGYFATTAAGERMIYLESPGAKEDYDVRAGFVDASDIPFVDNLLQNADLSTWSGGMPANWSAEGAPTVARDTSIAYAKHGGAAAHVTAAEDEGLLSAAVTLEKPEDRPYTGLMAGLTVVSGQVRVELRHSNGKTYPLEQQQVNEGVGVYLELTTAPVHDEPLPDGDVQVAVVAHGGAAEFYLDAAMVTPVTGTDMGAFLAGSGAHELWGRAVSELAEAQKPKVEYEVDIVDLFRVDPDAWPYDRLDLGDDVKVRHPDIGREDVRVVDLTEDLLRADATRVALAQSTRQRVNDVWRPQLPRGGKVPGGVGPGGRPRETAHVLHYWHQFDENDGKLYIGVLANPHTATLELYTKTNRTDAYPGSPADTLADRQGTFAGQQIDPSEGVFYQIVARDGAGAVGHTVEGSFPGSSSRIGIAIHDFQMDLTEDGLHVRATGIAGSLVDEIRVYDLLHKQPPPVKPWPKDQDPVPDASATITPEADGSFEYIAEIPAPQFLRYLQFDPWNVAASAVGPVIKRVINPSTRPPDQLVAVSLDLSHEDGSVGVQVYADFRAKSYRYAYAVGDAPSWPADAAVEAGTVRTIASADSFTLPAGTVGLGEKIRFRVAGYTGADGTGHDGPGDHGDILAAEAERTKFRAPTLEVTREEEDGDTGHYGVTVYDPDERADALYRRVKQGANAWGAWELVTNDPQDGTAYEHSVALQENHQSFIEFRLDYTLGGESGVVHRVSGGLDRGRIPNGLVGPKLNFGAATGSAFLVGDFDTAQWKVKASTSDYPDIATVRAETAIVGRTLTPADVGTLISGLREGDTVYYSALAIGPHGDESSALIKAEALFEAVVPTLRPTTIDETSTTGTHGVTLEDPAGLADGLYYRTKSGAEDWSGWTQKTSTPVNGTEYTETVELEEGHPSFIEWRLEFTLAGEQVEVYARSPALDPGRSPDIESLTGSIGDDGSVTANAIGDADVRADGTNPSVYVTVGVDASPADPTAADNDGSITFASGTRSGSVDTGVIVDEGESAFIKAVGVDKDGNLGDVVEIETRRTVTVRVKKLSALVFAVGSGCSDKTQVKVAWEVAAPSGYTVAIEEVNGQGEDPSSTALTGVETIDTNHWGSSGTNDAHYQYHLEVKDGGGTVVAEAYTGTLILENASVCPI